MPFYAPKPSKSQSMKYTKFNS